MLETLLKERCPQHIGQIRSNGNERLGKEIQGKNKVYQRQKRLRCHKSTGRQEIWKESKFSKKYVDFQTTQERIGTMPKVGGKKFAYTEKGMKEAKKYAKKKSKKVSSKKKK
jgi:hypothetical protein